MCAFKNIYLYFFWCFKLFTSFTKKACCILERENWKHLYPPVEEEFSGSEDEVIDVIDRPTQFANCLQHAKKSHLSDRKMMENILISATGLLLQHVKWNKFFPCVAIS